MVALMAPDFDPVEGIMEQPEEVQRAMLIQAVRSISRRQADIFAELQYIKRSIYGLLLTVVGGLILFVLTYGVK
jgi:hypothetical protein